MPDFLATLKALDANATGAPWEHDAGDGCRDIFHNPSGDIVAQGIGGTSATDTANAALIAFARNAAPRIAALVESVTAYRDATDAREAYDSETQDPADLARLCTAESNAYCAMLAARDALE